MRSLRDNWPWIVLPFVGTLLAAWLLVNSAGNDAPESGGDSTPFSYPLF
jgi:hypothetical protein